MVADGRAGVEYVQSTVGEITNNVIGNGYSDVLISKKDEMEDENQGNGNDAHCG